MRPGTVLKSLCLAAVITYLALLAANSLTRTRHFSPDSMNYVAVAANIASGKGITQPSLGFNQPHFSPEAALPPPFTSQPPLYPLAIAATGCLGISHADAALLVAAASYGLILLFSYLLGRELYGEAAGLLAVVLLLFYYPAAYVARYAWSEPQAIALALLSFWLLAWQRRRGEWWLLCLSGLAAGLAFATRYLLLVAPVAGTLALLRPRHPRRSLRDILLFGLGAALPALPVLGRNLFLTSTLTGASLNPSTLGLGDNLRDAVRFTFGGYLQGVDAGTQLWPLLSILLVAFISLAAGSKQPEMRQAIARPESWLLPAFLLAYLALLVYQRSQVHFDRIGPRLIAPAGVAFVILWAALLSKALALKPRHAAPALLLVAVLAAGREALLIRGTPPYDRERAIAASERLTWVAENTTSSDLIIGDDTMDIPFYFGHEAVLSFSPYPYTDRPEYDKLARFVYLHQDDYDRFFLVLRDRYQGEALRYAYGPFIADIVGGRTGDYPGFSPVKRLRDGYVFALDPEALANEGSN